MIHLSANTASPNHVVVKLKIALEFCCALYETTVSVICRWALCPCEREKFPSSLTICSFDSAAIRRRVVAVALGRVYAERDRGPVRNGGVAFRFSSALLLGS